MAFERNCLRVLCLLASANLAAAAHGHAASDRRGIESEQPSSAPSTTVDEPDPIPEAGAATTAASDVPDGGGDPAPAAEESSKLHLSLGAEITSAYYFRGFRYEDSGLIVQPYADLKIDVLNVDDSCVSLLLGTWSSFQSMATNAGTSDTFTKYWYEHDMYVGAGLAAGNWALEARYYFYTSPSDAFETVQELDFTAAFDDSDPKNPGEWSLQPSAVLAFETGSNANDDGRRGVYLQLGIAPGLTLEDGLLKDADLSFPVSIGLSLSNYYEGTSGENDAFGYVSVGSKLSVPLAHSGWTLTAGVQGLYLGDAASTFNGGDRFEVIATAGILVEF